MYRFFVGLGCLIGWLAVAHAGDKITLTTPEPLSPSTAAKVDILGYTIQVSEKKLTVTYQFLDATDTPIHLAGAGQSRLTWVCQDIPAPFPDNTHCIGSGNPDACCINAGMGICDVPISTCFSAQIENPSRGLLQVIWTRMRQAGGIRPGGLNGNLD